MLLADAFLPSYANFDSTDIQQVDAGGEFRIIPDIDNDGRAEVVTVAESIPGASLPCPSLRIHLSSTLSDGVRVSDSPDNQLVIYNQTFYTGGNFCGPIGKLDVLGDVNADGRPDLAVVVANRSADVSPLIPRQSGVVFFTPDSNGAIEFGGVNGNTGFLIDAANHIDDAGDLNADGFADVIINDLVVRGAASFDQLYSVSTFPDRLVLIDNALAGEGLTALGDVNGDGSDDILVGKINVVNQFAIVYGEPALSVTLNTPEQLADQYLLNQCGVSFSCHVGPAGDFDGDGYDDLAVSRFGCGLTHEAAVIYGGPGGVPRRDSIADYGENELTRVTDNQSGGYLSGGLRGSPGDLDQDGSSELLMALNGGVSDGSFITPSSAVVFGTAGLRPDFVSVDELDGTNGFRLSVVEHFDADQPPTTRSVSSNGVDIDGDGYPDLLDRPFDNGDPSNRGLFAGARAVIRGKDRELDTLGPAYLVVEQLSEGWQVRWAPPVAVTPARYRVLLDCSVYTTVESGVLDVILPQSERGPFQLQVQALTDAGATIGTTLRQVPARVDAEIISAIVQGPTLVELVFEWPSPALRANRYQVWRNGEKLADPEENASGFWDTTAEPGTSYTYYITPLYSFFNDVGSSAALRERPVLQRRSNSITVTTSGVDGTTPDHGGGAGPDVPGPDIPDVGVDPIDGELIAVAANVISWTAPGWHQVQSMQDYTSICEGGTECIVSPGNYVVINHDTGERISNIRVDGADPVAGIEIEGQTIRWPDDGWYQVQDADTYVSVCEGGRACVVPAGSYTVINHSTGQRWERLEVAGEPAAETVSVVNQTIRWPDNGWYQVQNADTFATLCEGGRSCEVTEGRYIVINHTTGQRYENIVVEPAVATWSQ